MAETWTPIDDPTAFQDDAVFEIDKKTKSIQVLIEQPIVAGENKSQFIKFQMGRYYDAIDLTQMEVNILYESPTGYQDISAAVNREYSDEYIRFGWLVPYAACPVKGTLGFAVEFVGADYVLKTTRGETPVLDSISGSSSVPEPVEQTWYIELQSQVASTLQTASDALEKSQQIINALATPQNAALASEMSDTSAVYVYTGSESGYTFGNWYYHNGTEWVSGGKYVSTDYLIDPTLTQSGQAADAKVVGDTIGDKSNLNTDDKTNLVSAINEINDRFVGSVEDVVNEWLDEHPEATTTVQDGAVTAAKLANNAVTEPKIASNSVSSAKIQDGAVSSAKIDASAVTSAKIANNAVSTIHIQDGAITTTKLNSEAVTTVKISDGAITEAKLASNSVSTAKLQDGAITEAKLADSVYLDKYINLSAIPALDIPLSSIGIDSTDGYTMQGACYNTDNNHIVIAFHKANNPVCIVKELDADWSLVKTASLTLYHANDITYNPNTGLYYVADGENSNTIYSVNSALTAVTTITVNVGGIIGQISYDKNNDRYYILSNNKKVYICDSSFGNVTYYATLNTANDYQSIQTIYIGGSCMCGDSFVSLLWFYSTYDQVTSYTRLCFANADKIYDGYFFDFKSQSVGDEAEALISMPDKMVSVGYTSGGVATRTYIYKNGYQASGMMCLLGNTYRNVNYVPVNSYGICTILASSSPTSADITGAYICYGNGQNKTLRITVNDTDYYRYCYGSQQWTAWHSNKEVLNALVVSEAKTIATGVSINANTSSSEYVIDIDAKSGYVPILATHRESSSPVVFPWYCYLVTSTTATSGYAIKARYRNTYTSNQTSVNLSAFVFYMKTP